MNKRLSISKDDEQNRSKKSRINHKRIAIGISVFISFIIIGNLISFIGNQISARNSEQAAINKVKEVEKVTTEWNDVLSKCSSSVRADNNLKYEDTYISVSIFLRYPKTELQDWSNTKGFRELDCFTKSIFGTALSERVNFQSDIPQSDDSIYLDENLAIKVSDGETAKGLWGAVSDNSFSSSYSSDDIIVQFYMSFPPG